MTQAKQAVADEDCLGEIIKLQLKKPKNWNWQLSTSRSSPHIALPIIQLFDARGKLLIETKDPGKIKEKSWTNTDVQKQKNDVKDIKRCRSDNLRYKIDLVNAMTKIDDDTIKISCKRRVKKSKSDIAFRVDMGTSPEKPQRQTLEPPKERVHTRRHRRSRSDVILTQTLEEEENDYPPTDSNNNYRTMENYVPKTRPRYKTRTSSAGTLIISEESYKPHHRRRNDPKKHVEKAHPDDHKREDKTRRHTSDPTDMKQRKKIECFEKYQRSRNERRRTKDSQSDELFYFCNDIAPFQTHADDVECNYIVQEPITPSSEHKSLINDISIVERPHRRRNEKKIRCFSDTSEILKRECDGGRNATTEVHGVEESKKKHRPDADLLRLVRRLAADDVNAMGANVSRHSAKGLSGRRSRSSGSICNGKTRQNGDGKICGSLPSYLDDGGSSGGGGDGDAAACNNNRAKADDVQRIPPLGDGAQLHWKFSDSQTVCDQGYGSERSPEEEYPPPLPEHDAQCHHHLEPHACYPFITPESTFTIKLSKSSRGLGLSVTGGIDSGGSWPGLIRIKRLFPHQPASACGLLNVGDLLIEVNGTTLTGLTNYEALEVLRTAPNQVELKVCRPPPDVLSCVSPISEVPPPPPRREPPNSLNFASGIYATPEDDYYHGEFEVTLTKIHGSLGFTLRKEDDSALGHYVRALVREPALTDGRIKAGDKIIAVNDVEISQMTHEQAVQYLRQCGDIVRLRLYRDAAQTPVAALSPTETTPRASFSRKAHLRQEAVDMLNDIAVRKLIPGNDDHCRRSLSPGTSPRRLRRPACPSDASHITDPASKYLANDDQFHEGLLQKCPIDVDAFDSLFTMDSEDDRPSRPSSLDLYNPNQTPVATRKPRFNFSLAHNAYELNNLDPELLDAPNLTYNLNNEDVKSTEVECGDSFPKEPASMPHIPSDNPGFSYKNPAYQSAHPQCGSDIADDQQVAKNGAKEVGGSITKWKGVVFDGDLKDDVKVTMGEEVEILSVELNRGWNSRLGFSLQGAAGVTYVSAVHADSVAARDGRLRPGDRVIKVNEESVEHMSTGEIINLLRIVRGPVCIVVSRLKTKEDCPKSNAEN